MKASKCLHIFGDPSKRKINAIIYLFVFLHYFFFHNVKIFSLPAYEVNKGENVVRNAAGGLPALFLDCDMH